MLAQCLEPLRVYHLSYITIIFFFGKLNINYLVDVPQFRKQTEHSSLENRQKRKKNRICSC